MNMELLNTPDRRNGILPEIIDFFKQEHGEDGWRGPTERFLRRFAGCEFIPPSHDALAMIDRDEQIVHQLGVDDSVDRRLELLREHRISYRHMQQIYMCVRGRILQPPTCSSRAVAVREAAGHMRRYPKLASEIASIYSLSAPEFGKALDLTPGREGRTAEKAAAKSKAGAAPTPKVRKKRNRRRT